MKRITKEQADALAALGVPIIYGVADDVLSKFASVSQKKSRTFKRRMDGVTRLRLTAHVPSIKKGSKLEKIYVFIRDKVYRKNLKVVKSRQQLVKFGVDAGFGNSNTVTSHVSQLVYKYGVLKIEMEQVK